MISKRIKDIYFETNVEGEIKIYLKYVMKKKSNIVFTSSVAVYGFFNLMQMKHLNTNPFNYYDESKLVEKLLRDWYEKNNLK